MGISVLVMMAISIAMSAMAAKAENERLEAESEAAARQAEADIREGDRQRDFVDDEAARKKSARVREAERDEATMQVHMDDRGGEGTTNQTRMSAEVAAYEGIDIARLEGNRVRQGESIKSQQQAAKNQALNIATQNKSRAKANTYKFLSSSAKTAASAFGGGGAGASAGSGLTSLQTSSGITSGFVAHNDPDA
jgi:hypothetical protein